MEKTSRACLWLLASLLMALPASKAQARDVRHHVTCADHYADWRSGFAPPQGADGKGKVVSLPRGSRTRIFTCPAGGHLVVMKYARLGSPLYHCGGATDGWISVWVDGTPVVERRQWGDYENCMAGEEERNAHIINRVLINDRLHLTVCEQVVEFWQDKPFAPSELLPGQTVSTSTFQGKTTYTRTAAQHCTLSDIRLDRKAKPVRVARTPPGLILSLTRSPICPAIGRQLVYFPDAHGRDQSLAAWRVRAVDRYVPSRSDIGPDGFTGEKTFALDVDNDGVPDRLIRHIFYSDTVPNQYSWVSGKTGKRYDLTGSGLDDTDPYAMGGNWPDPVLSTLHFIRWQGRTYLYLTMVGQEDGFPTTLAEYETRTAASPGTDFSGHAISRRIFEVKPDGRAVNLCNWMARKRPEEFL
jgi:hypothetical protein